MYALRPRGRRFTLRIAVACVLALVHGAASAVRPMTVDDANVDSYGQGHVDAWFGTAPGGVRGWTVVPDWVPAEGSEIDGTLTRDAAAGVTGVGLQIKRLFAAPAERGCNSAGSAALTRYDGPAGSVPQLNAIVTCNGAGQSVHGNVGVLRMQGAVKATWGVAWERSLGAWSANVEAFGLQGSKPAWQAGLRSTAGRWLVNTALGRSGGEWLWSAGWAWVY